MTSEQATYEQLAAEVKELRARVAHLEQIEAEKTKIEKELREKEAYNFALFSYSPVLTVIVNKEGKVIRSNKAKLQSGDRLPKIGDVMYRDYAAGHSIDMHRELLDCMATGKSKSFAEMSYGGRYLTISIAPFPQGAIITSNDITGQKQAENDRIKLIAELRRALDEVETLRGFLPICAHCKKIRDDKGLWNNIEEYISRHSFADFSHTLCPDCVKLFYPEIWEAKQTQMQMRKGS
jgi:hypothetical protein